MILYQIYIAGNNKVLDFSFKVPDASLKKNNICFLVEFLRRTHWLNKT